MSISLPDLATLPKHAPEIDPRELLEAGCHFGHQARKWHPAMQPWIYTEKDGVHLFDLIKTAEQLQKAYDLAYYLGKEGKSLVIVGTKRQAKEVVQNIANDTDSLYIASRWLGGLLTNWDQVQKSLKRMTKLEEGLASDAFEGYTKFERVQMEKELNKLKRFFGGLKKLSGRPDALFIIDPNKEKNAVHEALITETPMIAMVDSNADPRDVLVPIPANDDAPTSIEYIVKVVAAGYQAGRQHKAA